MTILVDSISPCKMVLEVTRRSCFITGFGQTPLYLQPFKSSFPSFTAQLRLTLQTLVLQSISFTNRNCCYIYIFIWGTVDGFFFFCKWGALSLLHLLFWEVLTYEPTACDHGGFDAWISKAGNYGCESKLF